MSTRNIEKEIFYSWYEDKETGLENETIDYPSLIGILTELMNRIEALENELEYQKDYAREQDERYG